MKKRGGAKKKIFLAILITLGLVILFLFGTKIYLYIQLLLGNDVVVFSILPDVNS